MKHSDNTQKPLVMRQGDTTTITLSLKHSLSNHILKIGIYTPYGKPLYEVYSTSEEMQFIDETHIMIKLSHNITKCFAGLTTLRCVIFNEDHSLVNTGENAIVVMWESEPANKKLNNK